MRSGPLPASARIARRLASAWRAWTSKGSSAVWLPSGRAPELARDEDEVAPGHPLRIVPGGCRGVAGGEAGDRIGHGGSYQPLMRGQTAATR